MSCLFSATFPDRVSQLVLYAPLMSWVAQEGFVEAIPPESADAWVDMLAEQWGEGMVSEFGMPSRVGDASSRELCARFERFALSRGAFRQLMRANTQIDIRPVLPLVRVPTLVLHRGEDRLVDAAHGRYYASHIDGAEFVELEGIDHYVGAGDWQSVARQVRRYLTGTAEAADHDVDRVLATVLFTDIVDSTATAARLGDHRWKQVLDDHDRLVVGEVARARGRVVKTTGDGALALFDGPARAVRCAESVLRGVRGLGIEARAGVHTGEVEQRGDDVGGIAVHIGARVASAAGAGQVFVSRTVVDLVVGSGLVFTEAGVHELKGVPGQWPLFVAA
jgi:class 3 adenylate cyclase